MKEEIIQNINQGLEAAYINGNLASNLEYKPSFISNNPEEGKKVISSIEEELLRCEQFQISVAFITMGGITPLLQTLKELERKRITGQILTTNYLDFSEPRALAKLNELKNITLKMYDVEAADNGFHTKGYIFKKEEVYRIILGSSNMTNAALTSNIEWNTKIISTEQGEVASEIVKEFNSFWNSEYALDFETFYEIYKARYEIIKHQREEAKKDRIPSFEKYKLKPNSMQEEFIVNLRKIIEKGEKRALLISATGTGKTYASAFAMRELGFKRVLFLVHRAQLAKQAKKSFERVFNNSVAGCGATSSGDETAKGDKSSGKVYYLNFKPEQADQWVELAKEYTDETGVQVDVQTAASGTYESQLKSEMAKDEAPTLFQVNGPVGLATWKNYCYDLSDSDVYKDVESDDYILKDGDAVDGIAYVIETYGLIYNKALLNKYFELPDASIKSIDDLNNFQALKTVAEEIQAHKDDLGVEGAFTSAGMDSSSDWRFKTHLANLPIYYEYKADGIDSTDAIKGTYLDNYKQIWDLYLNNSTCEPSMISSKTGDDAASEFALGEAVFYQNGTWAYNDIKDNEVAEEDMGMLPIYIGVDGEENQGLCTGSENYWCVNKNASEEDIQATLDFMKWVVESDEGRDMLANEMGFVTPFTTFSDYLPDNPLVKANAEYTEAGKTPVSWNFTTMPSENWKNNLGGALLNYAQGTGAWDSVQTAFVDGWAEEYAAANE